MATLKRKAGMPNGAGPDTKKPKQDGNIMSFFGSSMSNSKSGAAGGANAEPAIKFDKEKWVAGLTPEQKELLALEINTLHESWLAVLKDEVTSKEFLELKRFLAREESAGRRYFPPKQDIYSWSRYTPLHTVKVVILGQDPYHNVNQAHGLAFSVKPPTVAPPSLKNMYIALKNDYPDFQEPPRKGGLLTPWAERGVLLLNTCLTVRAHEANSHANRGWERFTQRVIDIVAAKRTRGVVFMAWGTPAGKRVMKVDTNRHLVLKAVHPSPLSAARGFFTCGHFKKANEWLVSRYGPGSEIDWSLVPKEERVVTEAAAKKVEVSETNSGDVEVMETSVKATIVEATSVLKKAEEEKQNGEHPGDDVKDAEEEKKQVNGEGKIVDGEVKAENGGES